MTPWMNEGFFADVAVLVEGEDDRAAILGTAMSLDFDLDRNGIAVIPCMGKNNLDRPMLIFKNSRYPCLYHLGRRLRKTWPSSCN